MKKVSKITVEIYEITKTFPTEELSKILAGLIKFLTVAVSWLLTLVLTLKC